MISHELSYKNKGLSKEELLNRDYKGRFVQGISRNKNIPERVILNNDEIPID